MESDANTKKTYKNKYYGRGYVQLTWGYNYQRLDEKIGNGSYPNKTKTKPADFNTGFKISNAIASIYLHPEKALEKENAYVGLVWGMQKGIYTGKKIGDYINAVTADYEQLGSDENLIHLTRLSSTLLWCYSPCR